jgi:hypothetical protein
LDLKRLFSRSQLPLHHPQTISDGCRSNGIPPVTAVEPPQNGLSTPIIASSGAYSPTVGVGARVLFVAVAVAFAFLALPSSLGAVVAFALGLAFDLPVALGLGSAGSIVAVALAFAFALVLRRGEPVFAFAFAFAFAFGRRFAAALQQWKTTLLALCFRGLAWLITNGEGLLNSSGPPYLSRKVEA